MYSDLPVGAVQKGSPGCLNRWVQCVGPFVIMLQDACMCVQTASHKEDRVVLKMYLAMPRQGM